MSVLRAVRDVATDRPRASLTGAYAVQGFGFAVMLTHIPAYKDALGVGDDAITLAFGCVCVAAGTGSALAGPVAARAGSRRVVTGGLVVAALGVAAVGLAPTLPLFLAAFVLYGLVLGAVDAALNMQGVDLERLRGTSLLGSFFAANAAGGVLGALAVSGVELWGLGLGVSHALIAVVVLAAVALLAPGLVRTVVRGGPVAPAGRPGTPSGVVPDGGGSAVAGTSPTARAGAPGAGAGVGAGVVVVLGVAMVAYPVGDSAVSSWGSVFLHDVLASGSVVAPLAYAAYQLAVIASRVAADTLVARLGRVRLVRSGGLLGTAGFVLVALSPHWSLALVGFAAVGLGIGVVAPMAFSAIGDRAREVAAPGDLERVTDQALARLNVFTYVGAVLGGVLTGVFATADHLRLGLVALALLASLSALLAGRFVEQRVPADSGSVTAP
ncbi:MFS transporter [Cellulomonas sp. PhB143]|uniref:MFS transporter n=1 Tax=Cellulomonas sp. PhB143 TaxID=2485186 RepID=UPI000F4A54BD|nr:MFS transporter [Cellulomonas sp. PhB143]ROS76841.1 sugar phosphate permease [Cellulomonas sp. PhB143]